MVSAENAAIPVEGERAVPAADGSMQTGKGNSGESAMKREPVKVHPDGREVCNCRSIGGSIEYHSRTAAMEYRQHYGCAICGISRLLTFDHQNGRGMGGSRGGAIRDDRIEIDGKWFNAALCVSCQSLKGSRRYHWVKENGQMKYVPQTPNPA